MILLFHFCTTQFNFVAESLDKLETIFINSNTFENQIFIKLEKCQKI